MPAVRIVVGKTFVEAKHKANQQNCPAHNNLELLYRSNYISLERSLVVGGRTAGADETLLRVYLAVNESERVYLSGAQSRRR